MLFRQDLRRAMMRLRKPPKAALYMAMAATTVCRADVTLNQTMHRRAFAHVLDDGQAAFFWSSVSWNGRRFTNP